MADKDDKPKGGGIAAALAKLRRQHPEEPAKRKAPEAGDPAAESAKESTDSASEPDAGSVHVRGHGKNKWTKALRISPEAQKKASRNRWMLVAGGAIGLVIVGSLLFGKNNAPPPKHQKVQQGIDLTPAGTLRQNFETSAQAQLLHLKHSTSEQQRQLDTNSKQLLALMKSQKDVSDGLAQLKVLVTKLANRPVSTPSLPAPPPAAPPAKPPGATTTMAPPAIPPPPPPLRGEGKNGASLPPPAGTPLPQGPARTEPIVITPESTEGGTPAPEKSKVGANTKWQKNEKAGYIPAGSFAPVVLLTGVEAGTATSSQSDPQPVLMRIERRAILPGNARYRVASCFALGSAYGSMSTERAYVRLARISCLDKNRKLVLDAPIKGYLADSDGMFGLRGTLVERRGALLAKTLLAGFASGLGDALGQSQGTSFSGSFGSGSTISGSGALRQAAFGGGSKAADQLAQFYLKQAQAIFPVIEVPPRRKATLVITDGSSLKWDTYGSLYTRQVVPEK
ncbi:MAG TPA: TrbI/VirB10 family protein [Nevskiaceae bacterium]